ncbi:type I 3-dehydroquinate dehydratase, partial [Candidatus Micrarchaeota archaeon]|nr:type I 3-dehydroquinate dehydratase [Candidatus Micrarchaeota archaeon]
MSIAEISAEKIISSLKGLKLAEIRMDKTQLSNAEIKKIFSMPVKLVATCRPNEELSNEKRLEMLLTAINSGAAYVDIELESSNDYADKIISVAKKKGCKIIVSYHNYDLTPEANELEKIKEKCFAMGADIAKIACKINSQQDNARIMDVITQDSKVIAIGMGA